ncbi:MAG: malonyl-CoA decarboxylase family protein [Actinomycetota bacterium]|nr:malonyl-CoA decarboxylase family protein [Actinomycetota bacterium]
MTASRSDGDTEDAAREPRSFLGRVGLRTAALLRSTRRSGVNDRELRRIRLLIDAAVAGTGGHDAARARAEEVGAHYLETSDAGRRRLLRLLVDEYATNPRAVDEAVEHRYRARFSDDIGELWEADARLRRALEPPWSRFLALYAGLPDGIKFLVDLRADLRRAAKDDPALAHLDRGLFDLLSSWFDIGLLDLRELTWNTPAAMLERLIEYESVHEIASWEDLKDRLDIDRRCFGYFHPAMPDEPLIFVEVALTEGMADDISSVLDPTAPPDDPDAADTAVFYSISNCQPGLAGVSLGDALIKRVVRALQAELPQLRQFVTLSPIPGFRPWLEERLDDEADELFSPEEAAGLATIVDGAGPAEIVRRLIADPEWPATPSRAEALRPPLMRLCARYLLTVGADERAIDRVANFHLSNGARVERINWLANASPTGLERSCGLMVNYRYEPDRIDTNHDAYIDEGRIISAAAVQRLAD